MPRHLLALIALVALMLTSVHTRTLRPRSGHAANPSIAKELVGIITTVAGDGFSQFTGDGGPAIKASLWSPTGLAVGPDGSIYIADTGNNRVRKVDPKGIITTVAGDGWRNQTPGIVRKGRFTGDGGPAIKASLNMPFGVALGLDGSLYIADSGNDRVRKVDRARIITTVAGSGKLENLGDGGPAIKASLNHPAGLAIGPDGSLYIADLMDVRICKVDRQGIITTPPGASVPGDSLAFPADVAVGADGSLYIAYSYINQVYKVNRKGKRGVVAGDGRRDCFNTMFGCYGGDGGRATEASLNSPAGVALDKHGNVYIADSSGVSKVDRRGIISTVAGYGSADPGDGGLATQARLDGPSEIEFGPDGSLYIADTGNHRIRKVTWKTPAQLPASARAALARARKPPSPPRLPGLNVTKVTRLGLRWKDHYLHWPQATFTPKADKVFYEKTGWLLGGIPYTIAAMDAVTGHRLSESLVPELEMPNGPSLSPDGKTLLLTGMLRTNQRGTRLEKITPDTYHAYWCAWSPDGREIAFEKAVYDPADQEQEHGEYSIAFMDPGKPGVIKREIRLANNVADGQYSPDGRWLSVQMVQMQGSPLALINLDTGKLQPIFSGHGMGLSSSPQSRSWMVNYAWLADSQHLLVTMVDDQTRSLHQIWLVNLKGETRKLADAALVWGRADGRLLVIMKDKNYWKVELGPGKAGTSVTRGK